jgi:hypothetical protein
MEVAELKREAQEGIGMAYTKVTFKDFAAVAKRRGHTPESLADTFRGVRIAVREHKKKPRPEKSK